MNKTDEALKLALEALEAHADIGIKSDKAITAIKQALAAPVQEPVGEVNRYGLDSHGRKWHGIHWYDPNVDVAHGTKLYTTPPAAQRQWVGLTDDEILTMSQYDLEYAALIGKVERKLKEKNAAAQPAVPDAIGPNDDELPAYAAGWNDCRQATREMMK
jgi:hypothetical protein